VIQCLTSHRTELSATCKMFLQQGRAERAAPGNPPPPDMSPPPPSNKAGLPPPSGPPNE